MYHEEIIETTGRFSLRWACTVKPQMTPPPTPPEPKHYSPIFLGEDAMFILPSYKEVIVKFS